MHIGCGIFDCGDADMTNPEPDICIQIRVNISRFDDRGHTGITQGRYFCHINAYFTQALK